LEVDFGRPLTFQGWIEVHREACELFGGARTWTNDLSCPVQVYEEGGERGLGDENFHFTL
jgi:hypothetical protein